MRTGAFARLPAQEQGAILREHGTIGRAYGLLSQNLQGGSIPGLSYMGNQGNNYNYNSLTFAENEERLALGRAIGEFNRGVIEILPRSVTKPDEADRQHLLEVALTSGRPVFFLGFDADAHAYVEAAAHAGAQLYNLLRAIPFNPRFTLKKTTFFNNLDVWDVVMAKPLEERRRGRLGRSRGPGARPDHRPGVREAAPRRRPADRLRRPSTGGGVRAGPAAPGPVHSPARPAPTLSRDIPHRARHPVL